MSESGPSVRPASPETRWPAYEPSSDRGRAPLAALTASHVDCLDGLRGLAAAWVVVGHAMKLTGWGFQPFLTANLAVDLFIALSGFLMAFHYERRRAAEPWEAPSTWWTFWTRRFFRIAPLYYLALAAALLLGPWIGEMRDALAAVVPHSGTEAGRYADRSVVNALAHVSFLFGLVPQYAYRTPLPDWSIGLEMQFYAAFPFLMLFWRSGRTRAMVLGALGITAACLASTRIAWVTSFSMASFLPLKLPMFLAGMLAAECLGARGGRLAALAALAATAVVCALAPTFRGNGPLFLIGRVTFVALLVVLPAASMYRADNPLRAPAVALNRFLATRPLRWLGDVSYGAYLLHLLVLIPVAAMLTLRYGDALPAPARFAAALAVTAAIVYPLSWALYRLVELSGIDLGKRVLRALGAGGQPKSITAKIATSSPTSSTIE
jgi:peptidoglycan/LPS O-acetylase OafA/YrhL